MTRIALALEIALPLKHSAICNEVNRFFNNIRERVQMIFLFLILTLVQFYTNRDLD